MTQGVKQPVEKRMKIPQSVIVVHTEYDEQKVLREYVLEHFLNLMTTNEKLGFKAVHADAMAGPRSRKALRYPNALRRSQVS